MTSLKDISGLTCDALTVYSSEKAGFLKWWWLDFSIHYISPF
jgi:hypothetical protein